METYGEVPPMIGFLGIDTDGKAYKETLDSKVGEIRLDKNEQKPISVAHPKSFYTNPDNRDMLSWLPEKNVKCITTLDKGAGQIRTNGRLAVVINAPTIINAIKNVIDRIRHFETITSDKYELDMDSTKDDIHLIFSLCGGTGCGTFIDIAYIIRKFAGIDSINLIGYAVLPDVFSTMVRGGTAMAKVKPNAYGAIMDLDYLMDLDLKSEKIKFWYPGTKIEINDMPFSAVHLIDNKNESNITYENIEQLAEMIALTLFLSSGKIADKVGSVNDNIEKTILEGTLKVGNKCAWVSSIGACEIVFKGHDLAEIYARKAAILIIDRMFDISCEDTNNIANNWIDSPSVNIRENNGKDNLINQICDAEPKYSIGEVDVTGVHDAIKIYYEQIIPKDKALNERITTIIENIRQDLHKKVVEILNKEECGVSSALSVLSDILRQINLFANEMTEEAKDLHDKLPSFEHSVKIGIENLLQWDKKSFLIPGRKKHIEEAKADIEIAVRNVAVAQIGIKRRDAANRVYTALKEIIASEYEKIHGIKKTLENVREELANQVVELQNGVDKRTAVFELDLSQGTEVKVNTTQIIVREFIDTLKTQRLYDLGDSASTIDSLLRYTRRLPETERWENTSIDSVLEGFSDEQFNELVRIATEKAKPLLKFHGRGYTVGNGKVLEQAINRYYFVGLPDIGSSRFTKNGAFKKLLSSDMDVNFITTGRYDRVILFRQEGVVPAFAINPLESYEQEYYACTSTFSGFDINIYEKMVEEGYSLMPRAKTDEDIEYWVKGLIFGFIKREDGKYWYRDWINGQALKDYWISTNEGVRNKAYEKFKRHLNDLQKLYAEKIEERINTDGEMAIKSLIDDVRLPKNYLKKYAQCELSEAALQKEINKPVAELMEEELQYVDKKLTASL
jgi:hypothetical protein